MACTTTTVKYQILTSEPDYPFIMIYYKRSINQVMANYGMNWLVIVVSNLSVNYWLSNLSISATNYATLKKSPIGFHSTTSASSMLHHITHPDWSMEQTGEVSDFVWSIMFL